MTIQRAIAYCQLDQSWEAGKTAAQAVRDQMGRDPDFLLLFASVGHEMAALLQGIQSVLGETPLAGCSGAGVISNQGCDEATHSLVLMGVTADRIRFHPLLFPELAANPEQAGRSIGHWLNGLGLAPEDQRLLLLFPDSFHLNSTALFRGIESTVEQPLTLLGGSASNDFHIAETYQFCNHTIATQAVSGVLLSGQFHYHWALSNGANPFGTRKTVTKSEANLIYEIDHQPATTVLQDLMGDEWRSDFVMLNLFTLGQLFDHTEGQIVNRAIFGLDEAAGVVKMGAEIPEGTVFRLTCRSEDKVLAGTAAMAEDVMAALNSPDEGIYLYFNCAGRASYLFGESDPDVNCLLRHLGTDRSLVGFFCFAEIAPVMNQHHLHNYTGILIGIEE